MRRKDTRKYFLWALFFCVMAGLWLRLKNTEEMSVGEAASVVYENALDRTYANYSKEAWEASEELDLPYEYLMALIVLECSGKVPPGNRFEPKVYDRLVAVRAGERRRFENIRRSDVRNASDEALRNLASSWGPFQVMGYKCIGLGVKVKNIRGKDGLSYGAVWIDQEYGKVLRKGHYKHAFHMHNTGRRFPEDGQSLTHDPHYVDRGLRYMAYFKKHPPK